MHSPLQPAHSSQDPSLSLTELSDGQLLLGRNKSTFPSPLTSLFSSLDLLAPSTGSSQSDLPLGSCFTYQGQGPCLFISQKNTLLFSPLCQETALASEQGPKHAAPPLAESGASWREGCSPATLLALTLASVMSSFCILSRAMSYRGGGAGLFFSLIQLSHMLTVILSPLSKAAGSFAITSPLLRLQVSQGSPGDRDEVVESQRQCDGGGDRPERLEDQPGST